ncbi:MAG: MotA/TolQ/ExbB proton channel family protein [Candidatus Sabulitectum sp.]|nr:MotA/TolQ/ExbB proton channel family protein [Candidatus Sabulitectum sp.]
MLLELYSKIGVVGFVLIVLLVISFYLFLKNSFFLWHINRNLTAIFHSLEEGKMSILEDERDSKNPLVAIIVDMVNHHANHSIDIKNEVAYLFHKQFSRVNGGITVLRLISVIAPLLGLMGTMLGMVKMFRSLGVNMADPTLLASGIWVALLTTILGLTVAIPTLAFYYFLQLRMKHFRILAIEYSYRVLGMINPKYSYTGMMQNITNSCAVMEECNGK